MKRNIIICLLMTLFYFSANAQLYYDEDQVRKEQEVAEEEARRIEEYNEFIRANQVDYDELHNRINNKLSNEIKKAQNQSNNQTNVNNSNNSNSSSAGIQIVNDDYDKVLQERRQAAARQKAKEQAKKAQREAEHQQWLAQKRAAQAAAAERERQRRERERIEQERRYKEAVADEYKKSAAHYNSLHAGVDYKATEGYERMYNTQPEGTERMQSSYMPSSIHIAKADIAYVIPKHSSGHTVSLTLNGNELSTLNSSDWDQYLINLSMLKDYPYPSDAVAVSNMLSNVNIMSAPTITQAKDYVNWIKQKYKELTGIDIDEITKNHNLSKEEMLALANYRDFSKSLIEEKNQVLTKQMTKIDMSTQKKEIDMSILAIASYSDNNYNKIEYTDYRPVSYNSFDQNDPMKIVAAAIENANATEHLTGFQAKLFYNEKTNEYTISFKGTDMTSILDWSNNIKQGVGKEFPQQKLTNSIIAAINNLPENAQVNIVGHSLGGALASYVGLATGKQTYTYNAEGVHDDILNANGLYEKKVKGDYKINAYYNPKDVLSKFQDGTFIPSAIGTRIRLDDMTKYDNKVQIDMPDITQQINKKIQHYTEPVTKPINKVLEVKDNIDAHSMEHIVEYNLKKYKEVQDEWNDNKKMIGGLKRERAFYKMRTLTSDIDNK